MPDLSQPFEPITKDLLYLKIADAIYAHIKQNHLLPGDKLPSERDMAQMFQTGRNSVREALRVLENRGLIEVKTGKGAFIRETGHAPDVLHLDLGHRSLDEIRELQAVIEYQAVQDAIQYASAEEKQNLLAIAREQSDFAAQGQYSDTLDYKFHQKILEMSHNRIFYDLAGYLRDKHFAAFLSNQITDNRVWLPTVPLHLELAQAIFRGDVPAALQAQRAADDYVFTIDRSNS